ncbi:superoxide dismutase family protein [Candidatus Arsenophonus triatominarum]|uniref:superoxide dismutase family protein n=1 Tax=Candidatus Arsenophonus triatominarum TaxID=57911 RepID=UPI0007C5125B|nr:superoxide dismutase family protein [Candidatus Arsenophonus triatominarum]
MVYYLSPNLQGLVPGMHGFHVHEYPSCDALQKDAKLIATGKAGGHFDPNTSFAPMKNALFLSLIQHNI